MKTNRVARFTENTAKRVMRAVRRVETVDRSATSAGAVIAQSPQTLFAVRVTLDGGSAGSLTTTCSWTYLVESDAGFQYGTGLTPARRRLPNVPYTTTPNDSWGAGFFDKDGTFVLWDANETPDIEEPCP